MYKINFEKVGVFNMINTKIINQHPIGVSKAEDSLLKIQFCQNQGPVVQSIVSLTSSLRGQLIKCFTTLSPNTLNFFCLKNPNTLNFFCVKNERSFCTAKASQIFSTKNIGIFEILTFEI